MAKQICFVSSLKVSVKLLHKYEYLYIGACIFEELSSLISVCKLLIDNIRFESEPSYLHKLKR